MMPTTSIWLPVMEVMARSCDVVLLVDADQKIAEVVSLLSLSSDLFTAEAVGQRLQQLIQEGDLTGLVHSDFGGEPSKSWRPVEMKVTLTDSQGRPRLCQLSVIDLPSPPHTEVMRMVAVSDLGGHSARESSLSHRALHDQLTGLLNRAAFLDRLDHSMLRVDRVTDPVLVIFIDLDEFKPVNDRFGHEVGDHMLAQIGSRIAAVAGQTDTVSRLGGDEFAVLIDHRDSTGHSDPLGRAIDLAQRVLDAISTPVVAAGVSARISASIGVAVAGADSTTSSLLHDADLAMYAAKRSGRGQIRIFDPAMREHAHLHVEYRREVPSAISRNQLGVVYLPHVDLISGDTRGWEALVRWEHPELGAIEPDEFVPIAERAGVMGAIGAWVRKRAARDATELGIGRSRSFPGAKDREFLSLNLSLSELRDPQCAEGILEALADGDLAPSVVVIEISEHILDLEDSVMMSTLGQLRDAGIRLALDDVGAGHSSVALLHAAPVDIVKLAPVVVATATEGHSGLAAAYIDLAHRRDLWVIAEGVETAAHQAALIELGCRTGHGRWLGEPARSSALP
jgi:diguanylate cyclase (GGDEF)-like protein